MLRRMLHRSTGRSLAFIVSTLTVFGCATSNQGPTTGGPGATSGQSGGIGSDNADASLGNPVGNGDGGGLLGSSDSGPTVTADSACQHLDVQFVPKIPLVEVLADRSGSIFQTFPDGGDEWDPLRAATLSVVQSLQTQVEFGFTAYTGINPNTTPGMCPILSPATPLPIVLNNYSAINAVYSALGQPMFKAETPAALSLDMVGQELLQTAAAQVDAGGGSQPGGKYILFVTDGETDFCDDGDPVCPADAVIGEIQKLYGEGITTLILGVGSDLTQISNAVLPDFANAGAGQPTVGPSNGSSTLSSTQIYSECNSVQGWNQAFTAAKLTTGQSLGTYAATVTANAPLYSPSAISQTEITNQLSAALKTVKSCDFDLQNEITVDVSRASEGLVIIDGTTIPYDATNGWTMTTATELSLEGTSCQQWRSTGVNISFNFPCDILIVPPPR